MSTSLRRLTPTTYTVYDATESFVGRVYRDVHKTWWAQRRSPDAQWEAPTPCASRRAAVALLEQA